MDAWSCVVHHGHREDDEWDGAPENDGSTAGVLTKALTLDIY